MRFFGKTTVSWIALTILSAAIALGQGGGQRGQRGGGGGAQAQAAPNPQSRFPEGAGRPILERACGSCHDAGAITTYHFATAGEYKDIVESMIGTGAQDSDTEK